MGLNSVLPSRLGKRQRQRLAKSLVVAVVVALSLTIPVVSSAAAQPASFPDVPATHPHYTAIHALVGAHIIDGYANGTFGPGNVVLRQQFAKMAVLTGGYPVSESDVCPFTDLVISGSSSLYPDNYIAVATTRAIALGKTATHFDPYAHITRYQVISMVVRMADDLQTGLLAAPPDANTGSTNWGLDPEHGANAARAEYNGLLAGVDLSLSPYQPMTRGEVAQVLYNLMSKLTATTTTTSGSSSTSGSSYEASARASANWLL